MALFKNVKVKWIKLDPSNPEDGFNGGDPIWTLNAYVGEELTQKWMDDGFAKKVRKDDEGFFIKLKRKTLWPSGDAQNPVKVVDEFGDPIDGATVGNGSVVNIQYNTFQTKFGNPGHSLQAVQVIELVKYEGNGAQGDEFSFAEKQKVDLDSDFD